MITPSPDPAPLTAGDALSQRADKWLYRLLLRHNPDECRYVDRHGFSCELDGEDQTVDCAICGPPEPCHYCAEIALIRDLDQARRTLLEMFEPMTADVRKTFEFELMPLLLKSESKGIERLGQLFVLWHQTDAYTQSLMAENDRQLEEIKALVTENAALKQERDAAIEEFQEARNTSYLEQAEKAEAECEALKGYQRDISVMLSDAGVPSGTIQEGIRSVFNDRDALATRLADQDAWSRTFRAACGACWTTLRQPPRVRAACAKHGGEPLLASGGADRNFTDTDRSRYEDCENPRATTPGRDSGDVDGG